MTTYTLYANNANSGDVECSSASASSVLDGTGSTIANSAAAAFAGYYISYSADQVMIEWDTSGVSGSISSATFSLYVLSSTTNSDNDTLQLRLFDFGASITTADYRTDTQFAACTLLAHRLDLSGSGYNDFTSDALTTNIGNPTTRAVLCTDRFAAGGTPTAEYYVQCIVQGGTSTSPKLTIVTADAPAGASLGHQPRRPFPGVAVTSGTTSTLHRALITPASTIGNGKPMLDPQRFRASPWVAIQAQALQHRSDQALFLVPPPATLARTLVEPQRFRRTSTQVAIDATAPPSRLPIRVNTGTPFLGRFDNLPLRHPPRAHFAQATGQPFTLVAGVPPGFASVMAVPARRRFPTPLMQIDQTAPIALNGSIWSPPSDDDESWSPTAPTDATWTPQAPSDATWN